MANCCGRVEMIRNLANFQKSGTFCDVTIRVGLPEERFHCHRNVLAAASPYFFGMFGGQMKESQADEVALRMDGVSPDAEADIFRKIVDYIYSRDGLQITSANACSLISAANYFQVRSSVFVLYCFYFFPNAAPVKNLVLKAFTQIC